MGKLNYRTDDINKKLEQIDELVGSNENLSNQINNFNSQLDNIIRKSFISVSDFGAIGKDEDYTEEFKKAIEYVKNNNLNLYKNVIHLMYCKQHLKHY